MSYEAITYEAREGIGYITLNRPQVMNALNDQLRSELGQALHEARYDDAVQVVIITGAGERAFSAGLDLREFGEKQASGALAARQYDRLFQSLPVAGFNKPVIAAVNGLAYGGGNELAMQCDIIVAAENATFAQMEVRRGIIPGAGGTQRLPRLVGKVRAMEIVLTGDPISAQEAHRIGLVNRVVPADQLIATAEEIARAVTKNGPIAVRLSKEAVLRGLDMTLDEGLKLERDLSNIVGGTEDAKEGPRAFAEKRAPQWKGR
jgi:enoyl-CoA hydratase